MGPSPLRSVLCCTALMQAWFEHRYLLGQQDLDERPAWAAALQVGWALGH